MTSFSPTTGSSTTMDFPRWNWSGRRTPTCRSFWFPARWEKILGGRLDSFCLPAKVEEHRQHLATCRGSGHLTRFETEVVPRDGRTVPVHISAAPIQLYDTHLILALYRDITEIKQAEIALRASEDRFCVALKNSSIIVFNQD